MAGQLFLHRVGLFAADGTAVTFGAYSWTGRPDIPIPPAIVDPVHGALYHVPMDAGAAADHWLRLHAEHWALAQRDPAITPHGNPGALRHIGGSVDATYGHVRHGGVFQWAALAHPVVQQHITSLAGLSGDDLVRYFAGPAFPD